MSSFTMAEPAVDAPSSVEPYRFTVEDYHRMTETGILPPEARVELIEGQIIAMTAPAPPHAGTVNQLNQIFVTALEGRAVVQIQSGLYLDEWSEPQPDVSILKPRDDWYKQRQPTADDALLVLEVAHTTRVHDRDVKSTLYARFGILEYWIVDVIAQCVEVHRRPNEMAYDFLERHERGHVSPISFPDITIDVASLF